MPPVVDRREPEQLPGARPRITQGWATSIVPHAEPRIDHFIGIDVSKATLDVASLPDGESWTVTNDDHGLAELTPRLVALTPSLVVLEATGGFEMLAAITLRSVGCLSRW